MHLLFWLISVNGWNIVFNPGVETTGPIHGLEDYWPEIILMIAIFYLYLLLPFVWLLKKGKLWLKVFSTILFLVPVGLLLVDYFQNGVAGDNFELFREYFLSRFMYVVVFHLSIACAVYYNLSVLVKKYLNRSLFVGYIASVFTLILLASLFNFALFDFGIDLLFPSLYFISYFNIWELMLVNGVYIIATTLAFLVWQYAAMLIAKRDQARNELSALKAQINPHFLFNNLNTIYSMALKNDVNTKEVILQLSDFLRYVLYDTASEYIPLEKEAEIIKTYVELQKSRINPEITEVELIQEGDFSNRQIAPLLLLPLAENCFKHGLGKSKGFIRMEMHLQGNHFQFKSENLIAKRENYQKNDPGGIGLANAEKRLNLLYSGKYSLQYQAVDGIFSVDLQIDL